MQLGIFHCQRYLTTLQATVFIFATMFVNFTDIHIRNLDSFPEEASGHVSIDLLLISKIY